MINKNERIEKLTEAGIDTSKYFTLSIPDGAKEIRLTFDTNGNPSFEMIKKHPIYNQIITDGYVRNTKLHRRFTMAQMFSMLNYTSWDGTKSGYTAALHNKGFKYTFKMMLEEVRVISKLEERDAETFEERSRFFDKLVVINTCRDYIEELRSYLYSIPRKNCKGVPYITVRNENIFVEDIDKKIIKPLQYKINTLYISDNYKELHLALRRFMDSMINLPWGTKQSAYWIDAYKGAGSFYTLKNLIMFHGCKIHLDDVKLNMEESLKYLDEQSKIYKGQYWRLMALMKKTIADNNFDFYKKMEEIYK